MIVTELTPVLEQTDCDRWNGRDLIVKCVRIFDETPDVKTFSFVCDPPILFDYQPGQFITLDLEIDGKSVSRSYSISSSPSRPHTLEITVKRLPAVAPEFSPGLVSNWLHDNLIIGQEIQIAGPHGDFSILAQPSDKVLFLSAGSGITPMMSMSRWIFDRGTDRDVIFFHNARVPEDIIFRDELKQISNRQPNFYLAVSLTAEAKSGDGLHGRLDAAMLHSICPDFAERTIFSCGPSGFMAVTEKILTNLNFSMDKYHQESFGEVQKTDVPTMVESFSVPKAPAFGLGALLDRAHGTVGSSPLSRFAHITQFYQSDFILPTASLSPIEVYLEIADGNAPVDIG